MKKTIITILGTVILVFLCLGMYDYYNVSDKIRLVINHRTEPKMSQDIYQMPLGVIDNFERDIYHQELIGNGWIQYHRSFTIDGKLIMDAKNRMLPVLKKKVGNLNNSELYINFSLKTHQGYLMFGFNSDKKYNIDGTYLLLSNGIEWTNIEIFNGVPGLEVGRIWDMFDINKDYIVKIKYDKPLMKIKYYESGNIEPEYTYEFIIEHQSGEYIGLNMLMANDERKSTIYINEIKCNGDCENR